MSLINYIKEHQRNYDGTYYVTDDQLYRMRKAHVELRRLAWRLMRGFKFQADRYLIPTRWNKPYRAMKAYFADRKSK